VTYFLPAQLEKLYYQGLLAKVKNRFSRNPLKELHYHHHYHRHHHNPEVINLEVMLKAFVWEVLDLNLGPFSGFLLYSVPRSK
jgi:hypothetical protein